jgi:hypothetical protein
MESHGKIVSPLCYREIVEAALSAFGTKHKDKFNEDREALTIDLGAERVE